MKMVRDTEHTLLSAGTLGLGSHADADQTISGLKLLHGFRGVVDEGEAGGLATTELGSQTKDRDLVLLGLVHAAKLLAELLLGDVGTAGVKDIPRLRKHIISIHEFWTKAEFCAAIPEVEENKCSIS